MPLLSDLSCPRLTRSATEPGRSLLFLDKTLSAPTRTTSATPIQIGKLLPPLRFSYK